VALKWVTGMERIGMLRWEAGFYETQLKGLQGIIVPTFYGLYTAKIEGVDVGCLVLEWCGGVPDADMCELNRQKLLAACKIHRQNVYHGRLMDGNHFVPGTQDNSLRIINFSHAGVHCCPGGTPLMINPNEDTPRYCSECTELAELEETFGPDTGDDADKIRIANGLCQTSFFSSLFYQ